MLTKVDAATLVAAGDVDTLDLGAECEGLMFKVVAALTDGSKAGLRVVHSIATPADPGATGALECIGSPYYFKGRRYGDGLYRFLGVKSLADGTEVTVSIVR